ncbi:DeoR family transcriptional regulator [Ruminococcaceae bacterium BL-6]|nr:DeoR family transcriptional regulator [Ruminococcaceae bacterium BL-6]
MSLEGEDRKAYILDMLDTMGKVKVNLLSEKLQVTPETIRRYLEELERENRIKRVYGGAVKVSGGVELPYADRTIHNIDAKRKIGKSAARLVCDGELIVIDVGTTTLQMVQHILHRKNLVVVTSSFGALKELIQYRNSNAFSGRIIFVGGDINSRQMTVSGTLAEDFMENLYADKAFVSVAGFSLDGGLTSYDLNECTLTRKILHHAGQSIVLADQSKIGCRNHFKIGDLSVADKIICNAPAPAEWETALAQMGVEWICTE